MTSASVAAGAGGSSRPAAAKAKACKKIPGAHKAKRCRAETPKVLARSVVLPIDSFVGTAGSDPRIDFAAPNVAAQVPAPAPDSSPELLETRRKGVRPVFECVYRDATGQPVAVFGYDNATSTAVSIPVGRRNRVSPRPHDHGQPRTFRPGRVVGAYRAAFAGTRRLVWSLDRRTATADATSTKLCADPSLMRDQFAVVTLDETGGGPEYWSLKAMGVPSVLATSIPDALGSRVVILAGTLSAGVISAEDRARLEAHVARGGVVIGEAVTDPALYPLFGIDSLTESAKLRHILWGEGDVTTGDLNRPEERDVDLGDNIQLETIGTVGYTPAYGVETLATFEDLSGAVLRRRDATSGGAAYVVGARLLDLVTRHQEGARLPPKPEYANQFDTSSDSWLLWLRGVHRAHVAGGVTISTAPQGKRSAVIPTLSLNFSDGLAATEGYVAEAHRAGATPTVFVWPHYVTDWLDKDFFNQTRVASVMRSIRAHGAEIGSHSVSHSPVFNRRDLVPLGTGAEAFPTYRPFVALREVTKGATVLGDLRVSKQLLQTFQPEVTSYRQGYLLTRPDLVTSESAVGYRNDSSTQQGIVGGAFPFMVPRFDDKGFSDVVTFPIVLEDERSEDFDTRVDKGLGLIAANAENGAPSVVLVHPNPSDVKRAAWGNLLRGLPADAWRGTLASFGTFWEQRLQGQLAITASTVCAGGRHVELRSPRADWPLERQALDVADPALTDLRTGSKHLPVNGGKVALPAIPGGGTFVGDLCPSGSGGS